MSDLQAISLSLERKVENVMLCLHMKKEYKEIHMYLLICAERNTGKINQVLLRLMTEN